MVSARKREQTLLEVYLKIHELAKKGLGSFEISNELGLPIFDVVEALLLEFSIFEERISETTRKSIKKILKRVPSPRDLQIIEYLEQGLTLGEIGKLVGVTRERVRKIVKLSGVEIDLNQMKREPSARDLQIIEYRKQGLTLDEIGKLMGITRERVRQIIKLSEVEIDLNQIRVNQHNEENIRIFETISKDWDNFKLKKLHLIAVEFGISTARLSKCISRIQYVYLKANQEYKIPKSWTDAQCLEGLVDAATYEFPLTVARYQQLLKEKTIEGPTVAIFVQRFGSWVDACTLAGVEYGETLREYDRTWNDNELLRFVRRFMYETQHGSWSTAMYDEWRKRPEVDGPSIALLRNYLGSWSEIRVSALELESAEFDMKKFTELGSNEK